ncbi:MAG: riboflavin kinase, partial [Acidobacteria bacterium]|nr:riboflavin kinase [Acidobacteriota bacterium]
ILDFDDDIYGQEIRIDLLHRLRDELRFDSVDDLVTQMRRDIEDTLAYIRKRVQAEDVVCFRAEGSLMRKRFAAIAKTLESEGRTVLLSGHISKPWFPQGSSSPTFDNYLTLLVVGDIPPQAFFWWNG